MGIDPLGQDAAEDVAPGIVGRNGDAGLGRRGGEFCPVALPRVDRRQQIDAGVAFEGFAPPSHAPARRRDRYSCRGR